MLNPFSSAVLLLVVACSGQVDAPVAPGAECGMKSTQREVDTCYYEALLATAPASTTQAFNHAQSISDPVIQGAAILKWVQSHNRQIQADEGRKLCRLLGDRERTACERRLYSAHLQR